MKIRQILILHLAIVMLLIGQGCAPTGNDPNETSDLPQTSMPSDEVIDEVLPNNHLLAEEIMDPLPDTADVDPENAGTNLAPENMAAAVRAGTTRDVLIFNGKGISTSDWQNTEKIVKSMGLSYSLINSAELNAMSLAAISKHGLMIVPGGKRGGIMSGLTNTAQLRVRQAVRDQGVSYLGFCAGSFAAVGTLAFTNKVSEDDLAVIYGKHLPNWWPNGQHITADMVKVRFPNKSSRWLVWWGGPWTPEWKGGVIARYADGKPAISQGWSKKGFVILTGPHPEAPQSWRNTAGYDPDGLDYELTKKLIKSALTQTPMPAFR